MPVVCMYVCMYNMAKLQQKLGKTTATAHHGPNQQPRAQQRSAARIAPSRTTQNENGLCMFPWIYH